MSLSKAQRLALAAAVAPTLRSESGRAKRVKLYDQETGEVTGETSLAEAQRGILRTLAIEIDVAEGRPDTVACTNPLCRKPIKVSSMGLVPKVCLEGCHRVCVTTGCGRPVSRSAAVKNAKAGTRAMCLQCSVRNASRKAAKPRGPLTDAQKAQRSRDVRAAAARRTPEERSAIAQKIWTSRRSKTVPAVYPDVAIQPDDGEHGDS